MNQRDEEQQLLLSQTWIVIYKKMVSKSEKSNNAIAILVQFTI